MRLHGGLLEQARHLLTLDPGRPREASLRRAISAAYYALFHLLIFEASKMLVNDESLRLLVSRAFVHGEMQRCSKSFAAGNIPQKFDPIVAQAAITQQLKDVAQTFVSLQQARHDADYNLARRFKRREATALVEQAERAFANWQACRDDPCSRLYLSCLLLWERFDKIR